MRVLLERDVQAGLLATAFEAARTGRCQVVLVTGATGTGKTELFHSFADRAADTGAAVLLALGTEHASGRPLGILHQLLTRATERRAEPPADRADRLERLDRNDRADRNDRPDRPGPDAPTQVAEALHTELAALALRQPIVIGVDDLHHADNASLRWLPYLIGHLRQHPVLFVLTQPDHERGRDPVFLTDLLRLPTFHQIRLKALSPAAVEHAFRLELGSAAASAWARRGTTLTAGNPLLLRALLRDYGQAVWQHGGPREDREPPATGAAFAHAVTAWLHRCGGTVQAVARALAVIDTDDCHDVVADLLRMTPDTVADACRRLADAGLATGTRLAHTAARTAVAALADPAATRSLHRRAARCLYDHGAEAGTVARNLLAARDVSAPWSPTVLIAAAVQALRDDDIDNVLGYLALVDSPGVPAEHRLTAAAILMRVHWRANPANSLRHIPTLESALRADTSRTCHAVAVVKAMLWPGHTEEAARFLTFLRGHAGRDTESATVNRLLDRWTFATYPAVLEQIGPGTPPPGGTHPDTLTPDTASPDHRGWPGALHATLTAVESLARTLTDGPHPQAAATATALLRHSELDDGTLDALEAALLTLLYGSQAAAAAHWAARLLDQATTRNVPLWQATFAAVLAEAALRLGRPQEAARHARAALAALPASRWGAAAGTPVATLVQAADTLGRHDEAAALLRRPVPAGTFESRHGLPYLYARGRHQLLRHALPAALADFLACGDLATRWGQDRPFLVPWRSGAATALLGLGDHDQAARLAAEQLGRVGPEPSRGRGIALRTLAAVSDPADRLTHLTEAVATLEIADDRLTLAETLLDLGAAHWAAGEHTKARRPIRRALRLAEQADAEPLRTRGLEQIARYRATTTETAAAATPAPPDTHADITDLADLAAITDADTSLDDTAGTGTSTAPSTTTLRGRKHTEHSGSARRTTPGAGTGHPGRTTPPPPPLTSAEARVATLASLGLTNRQIAERLYVTTSTVEQHLTHVYRKLRVAGRADLPIGLRRVRTPGPTPT